MGIGANHESTGEGIIFQKNLVNNPGTWFPESDTVFVGNRCQKIINFFVFVHRLVQICNGTGLGLDQVIAVNRTGNGHRRPSGLHELEEGHLSGGILHGHPIGGKIDVINPSLEGGRVGQASADAWVGAFLAVGIPEVGKEDFFGEGQRPSALLPYGMATGLPFGVVAAEHRGVKSHGRRSRVWSQKGLEGPAVARGGTTTPKIQTKPQGVYLAVHFLSKKPTLWAPAPIIALPLAGFKT